VPIVTVEVPEELYEKMRRFDVDWSSVVRKAIEDYIEELEKGGAAVPAEELLEELVKRGVSPLDLEPLSPEVEDRMYSELREKEWERVRSTIQAQSSI
jgi:Arc/MetJ-type ribon-helix-helix transcriptional regulator